MSNESSTGLNRRDFLKVAGIGAAAMTIPMMGFTKNAGATSIAGMATENVETDVLVIGGGYAGVWAALNARAQGVNVTIIEKGTIFKSGLSPFARGFSYFEEETQDAATLKKFANMIGEYVSNPDYLDVYMKNTKKIKTDMESWGFFTTGTNFSDIMRQQVIKSGAKIVERTMVTNLLKKNGRVVGAVGIPVDQDKAIVINAKAVILCAGAGSFKSYGFFSHPITSDGDAMAYRVGAEISGKEYQDTHGTASDYPADSWLGWQGMLEGTNPESVEVEIENNLNLSSYITAHVSGTPVARGGGDGIKTLYPEPGGGITWGGPENLTGGGGGDRPDGGGPDSGGARPEGDARPEGGTDSGGGRPDMAGSGARPEKAAEVGGASAGLSVHKAEGLFPADGKCASNIPGLYGAGDALSSMLYGSTYALGGASSSGSASQGYTAGEAAAKYAAKNKRLTVSTTEIKKIVTEIFAPRELESGYSVDWLLPIFQNAMIPYYVLYVKKQDRLQAALANVMFFQEHFGSKLMAEDSHQLRMVHEMKNMMLNAEMKLRASLYRTESRGNHYREDFPARDDKNWLCWVVLSNDNGTMKLKKVEVPDEVKPDPKVAYEIRYPNRFPNELEYVKANKIS
jgi:succinate dehydrogenase/fumarate reductase flavoprotein subunit